jgi:Tfp pilus assembly protein PilX
MQMMPTAEEQGTVAFVVLAMALCMSVVAATMLTVALQLTRIEGLHDAGRQAYWLARSAAWDALSKVRQQGRLPSSGHVGFPNGSADVVCTCSSGPDGTVWVIRAVAHAANAVDRVSLSYNATTHTVLSWQDNGPAQ